MTINVLVKCPDGIVMGADSLLTILDDKGKLSMVIPYYSKLFSIDGPKIPKSLNGPQDNDSGGDLGTSSTEGFAAGVMVNGHAIFQGRPITDIIEHFAETYDRQSPYNYSLRQIAHDLSCDIQKLVTEKKEPLGLEIIVGGYSRGQKASERRTGEAYSLFWRIDPDNPTVTTRCRFTELYTDQSVGIYYGGVYNMLDRFLYALDPIMIREIWNRRERLFNQVRDYLLNQLESGGLKIEPDLRKKIELPNDAGMEWYVKNFNIFNLVSKFEDFEGFNPDFDEKQILNYVSSVDIDRMFLKHSIGRLRTMEQFFSLQTAINYCTYLLWCAYAQGEFTSIIPRVGSEMKVATITRQEGFKFRRIWKLQTPGPPFR